MSWQYKDYIKEFEEFEVTSDEDEDFVETMTTCSDFRRITHPGFEFSDDSDYDNI